MLSDTNFTTYVNILMLKEHPMFGPQTSDDVRERRKAAQAAIYSSPWGEMLRDSAPGENWGRGAGIGAGDGGPGGRGRGILGI